MPEKIRVGLLGAGANTILRHIPGLRAEADVEIVAVANRSHESSERVASEFEIPQACEDWMEIIEDEDIDAVCIGTWPYMHSTLTLAALNADKHVLCEARMASSAAEAYDMLESSRENPHLTCQIVPAPHTLPLDRTIIDLIDEGFLGDLVNVRICIGAGGGFPDLSVPLHWRNKRELSGNNIMTMGIWYEAIMRWVGQATTVMANAQVVVKRRKDENGHIHSVTIPDHLDILCDLAAGGTMNMSVTTVSGFAPECDMWLHGSEGVLRITSSDFSNPAAPELRLMGGKRGDASLKNVEILPEKKGTWRVEQEFVNAIREIEPVTRTNFTDGVKYMEWTDAVTESWQTEKKVRLLLP